MTSPTTRSTRSAWAPCTCSAARAPISDAVADEAEGDGATPRDVQRVAGANRYATAAEIATSQDAAGIGEVGDERTAMLAERRDLRRRARGRSAGPRASTCPSY